MKTRSIFALSLIVISVIGVIVFIIDKFIVRIFPASSSEPAIVIILALIVGVGAFLSSLNGVMDLVDRLFPGQGKILGGLKIDQNFPKSGPLSLFLCHSSSDRSTVVDLHDRMVADQYNPKMDNFDLLPGQDRDLEITRMVGLSHAVIVCLSSKSINKDSFFLREINLILDVAEQLPKEKLYLIPLRLDNCEIPERLRRWQWVNLYEENGYDHLVNALRYRARNLKLQNDEIPGEGVGKKAREMPGKSRNGNLGGFLVDFLNTVTARPRVFFPVMLISILVIWGTFILFPSVGKNNPKISYASQSTSTQSASSSRPQNESTVLPARTTEKPSATPSAIPTKTIVAKATSTPLVVPTIASTYGPSKTMVSAVDGMEMVLIPAGDFLMGYADSDTFGVASDKPQHKVYLDRYWIDRTEVTNAQYARCVDAKKCNEPMDGSSNLRLFYYGYPEYESYPRVNINWNEAVQYCAWAGRRLPTEAEWEKAARGFDGRRYPWGNYEPTCDLANYGNNTGDTSGSEYCVGDTSAVGSYPEGASPYGVMDLAGNAWEWVSDWYSEDYYKKAATSNPHGAPSGEFRVTRGGCSISTKWHALGTASRSALRPERRSPIIGFRCVMPEK